MKKSDIDRKKLEWKLREHDTYPPCFDCEDYNENIPCHSNDCHSWTMWIFDKKMHFSETKIWKELDKQ